MKHHITSAKRILKAGFNNFIRNGLLSTATISVLSVTLFIILSLILVFVLTEALILNLQNRVDVSVYFKKDIKEENILQVRNDLLAIDQVKSVDYISEDNALIDFRDKHTENAIVLQSLDIIEENPFSASLNVKVKDTTQFSSVVGFLEKDNYKELIDKVNYYENEELINNLNAVVTAIRKVGFAASAVLAVIAFLVAFNTIRITIYTSKDEINIMKLVGAANLFIRGPFFIEGALHGFISSVVAILIAYPILLFASPHIEGFFPGADIFSYFTDNLIKMWLILFFIGAFLGSLGSLVAMQKYLKI